MEAPAVTEFFSLDDAPAKPLASAEDTVRDHYGFMVPADYHELYRVYSPVWEQEETEREAHWCQFLIELAHLNADDGKFANLEDLCSDYLQDAVTIARHERGLPSQHRQKLDALVHGGVPFTIRGSVWTVFLDTAVRKQRNYYNDLVKRCLGDLQYRGHLELDEIRQQAARASQALQDAAAVHGLAGYAAVTEKALSTWRANSKVWLTQIEKDLPRTFPGLLLMEVSGRPALRRVLAAYSLHNSRVGYCQGLNFVAGTLLLFLDEEDAFWCLCALLEDILKGYYDVDMMAMQVDQRVFKRLVSEHFPKLAAHLEGLGADVSCVFVQWFLCVFVNFLPIEACLRVWDELFYHRSPTVLFKTALALLEVFDPALSCCTDVLDALDLLQTMAPLTYDSNRLIEHAFGPTFDGVTDGRLATLRREYREEVEAEAAALAEELTWEASSSANGATSGTGARSGSQQASGPAHQAAANASGSSQTGAQQQQQPQPQPQPQQSNSRISVLKMIARGMKEKFAGVGGAGSGSGIFAAQAGSGANSVDRAASPVPDASLAAAIASLALGGESAAVGCQAGSADGGSSTTNHAAAAAVAVDGNAEEPLLVRSPHPFDGGGVDADSEDYHRFNGDDGFQYEQVGYVAPSDISETGGPGGLSSIELLSSSPPLPPPSLLHPLTHTSVSYSQAISTAPDENAGTSGHKQQQQPEVAAAPSAVAAVEPTLADAGSAAVAGEGLRSAVASGPAPPAAGQEAASDPLKQLLEFAAGITSTSASEPATSTSVPRTGGYTDMKDRSLGHSCSVSSSSFVWHETPKWTSIRAVNAGAGAARMDGSTALTEPQIGISVQLPGSPGSATHESTEPAVGPMSPHVLMLAAGRSQSLPVGFQAIELEGGGGDDEGLATAKSSSAAASSSTACNIRALPLEFSQPSANPATGAATAIAAMPPPKAAAEMAALHGAAAAAGPGPASDGTGTVSDFSQVQAADQARRAQGCKRRCSKAASMAWDIALAPLKLRQQMQQQRHQNRQAPSASLPSTACTQQTRQSHSQSLLLQEQCTQPASASQRISSLDPAGGERANSAGHHSRATSRGSVAEAASQNPQTAAARGHVAASLTYGSMAAPTSAFPLEHPSNACPDQAASEQHQWRSQGSRTSTAASATASLARHAAAAGQADALATWPMTGRASAAVAAGVPGATTGHGFGTSPPPAGAPLNSSAAVPLASARAAAAAATAGFSVHPQQQHPYHHPLHHPLYTNSLNDAHLPGGGGAAGGTARVSSLHAPPGSSVTSTCSVLVLDEHKEASPVEARDEWVIMSAPSDGPTSMPSASPPSCGMQAMALAHDHRHGGGLGSRGTATVTATGIPAFGPMATDRDAAAVPADDGGGGGAGEGDALGPTAQKFWGAWPDTYGVVHTATVPGFGNETRGMGVTKEVSTYRESDAGRDVSSGVRAGALAGAGGADAPAAAPSNGGPTPAAGRQVSQAAVAGAPPGAAAEWKSPLDAGGPAVQEMREALGVEDLIRQHSLLAARLRRLMQPPAPAPGKQWVEPMEELRLGRIEPATFEASSVGSANLSPSSVPKASRYHQGTAPVRHSDAAVDKDPVQGVGDVPPGDDPSVGHGGVSACRRRAEQLQRLLSGLAASLATPTVPSGTSTTAATAAATAAGAAPSSVLSAPSIAAAAGGNGSPIPHTASTLLPEALLPLSLPYAGVQPMPAVTPFDQLVVGPGGQVRLQSAAASPPVSVAATAAAGVSEAANANAPLPSTASSVTDAAQSSTPHQQQQQHHYQQQQEILQDAVGLCSVLLRDLSRDRQREVESSELLEQYDVLSEVLAARLDELVQQLAEKQYTIDKLSSKLDQTMQKYAAQDTALADKDYAIRNLQFQLQAGHTASAAATAATAAGGGGGGSGPISGLSSALGFGSGNVTTPPPHSSTSNGTAMRGTHGSAMPGGVVGYGSSSSGGGGGGGGFSLVPGGVHNFLGGGGPLGGAGSGAAHTPPLGRHTSPPRGGNQSLLWQFGKNWKAKFSGRDEQSDS